MSKYPLSAQTAFSKRKMSLALLVGACFLVSCKAQLTQEKSPAKDIELTVHPFAVDSGEPPGWSSAVFAESLAIRLRTAGIKAAPPPGLSLGRSPELTLTGDVKMRNNRMMITAVLSRRGESMPVWKSTYWREAGFTGQAAGEVSVGVAEAIYANEARHAMSRKEKTP